MPQGLVAFWRYRQPSAGYRGYHIAADVDGCDHILSQVRARRPSNVNLAPVTEALLSVPNSTSAPVPFVALRIQFGSTENDVFIEEKHPRCTVTLSENGARDFEQGIRKVATGGGDYAIGPEGHEIWFWWWPPRA